MAKNGIFTDKKTWFFQFAQTHLKKLYKVSNILQGRMSVCPWHLETLRNRPGEYAQFRLCSRHWGGVSLNLKCFLVSLLRPFRHFAIWSSFPSRVGFLHMPQFYKCPMGPSKILTPFGTLHCSAVRCTVFSCALFSCALFCLQLCIVLCSAVQCSPLLSLYCTWLLDKCMEIRCTLALWNTARWLV